MYEIGGVMDAAARIGVDESNAGLEAEWFMGGHLPQHFTAAYSLGATLLLLTHVAWILWVIFGAIWTRNRPLLAALHIASLAWGVVVELGPWACPLTFAEQFFEGGPEIDVNRTGFIVHLLDRIVYPDIPLRFLTFCGVAVCVANLAVYARRYWRRIQGIKQK